MMVLIDADVTTPQPPTFWIWVKIWGPQWSIGHIVKKGIPCLNYQTSIEIPYTDVYYLQNTCMAFKWLNNIYFGGTCSQIHHTRMAWDRPPRRYILCCNSDMLHPSPSLLTLGRNRAPLAAILGFKSSTFPSSDCCLANCLAFISSFRGIHGFLGTLHCFKLPSQPGQPARTGLSCHVEEHSFLGRLSISQAFETRIQSENPIPNKLEIRGIWQTISQLNFVARSFLGRQLGWRWKHGKSHSFVVFFSYSSPEACVALWWRDWGWRPPTIQSSIATCPASGPFSACGLRWHCNMHWDV